MHGGIEARVRRLRVMTADILAVLADLEIDSAAVNVHASWTQCHRLAGER